MKAEARIGALTLGLVLAAAGASAGTTLADVQGTKMAVFEPSQMPEFVRVELKDGYSGISQDELLRRVQLAVEGLTGCNFAEQSVFVRGSTIEVGFDGDCWFHGYYDSGSQSRVLSARDRIVLN